MTFGTPIAVDEFIREHPAVVAADFEQRKPDLQRLADDVMNEISAAAPITPVPLAARIFAEHPAGTMAEEEIVREIAGYREKWSKRVWTLRETTPAGIWVAARDLLLFRHLIESVDGGWRWRADETLLRDFYANSLMTFDEVKRRGWPERAVMSDEALAAAG